MKKIAIPTSGESAFPECHNGHVATRISVKGCRRNSISTQIQTTKVLGWWNTVLHTFWLPCRCVGNASERRMCPMCFLVVYQSFGYPAYKYANDLKPKCLNSLPHNGRFRRWKGENTTVIDKEQRSYGAYHEIQPDCGYFMNLWSLPLVFGRGGCFLHCGRQTQRFSSIGGVQERDLRIWHQVVECCPLLASRRTVSDRKWENSTTSGERLVAAAHRKHWNVEEFEVLRSKSGVQSPSTVHQTGDAKNVRSRAFPSKDAPNPIPSLPFKAISGDPYKPCWGQLRRRAVSSGHSC